MHRQWQPQPDVTIVGRIDRRFAWTIIVLLIMLIIIMLINLFFLIGLFNALTTYMTFTVGR